MRDRQETKGIRFFWQGRVVALFMLPETPDWERRGRDYAEKYAGKFDKVQHLIGSGGFDEWK